MRGGTLRGLRRTSRLFTGKRRGDLRVVALNFDGPAHGLRHSLHSAARLVARTRTGPGHGAIAHGEQQTGIEQAEHVHVPANRSLL